MSPSSSSAQIVIDVPEPQRFPISLTLAHELRRDGWDELADYVDQLAWSGIDSEANKAPRRRANDPGHGTQEGGS